MTRIETAKILAVLTAAYPNHYKNLTSEEAKGVVTVWSLQFRDIPADIVFIALNKAIAKNKFPPTIAEIKENFAAMYYEATGALNYDFMGFETFPDAVIDTYRRIIKYTKDFRSNSDFSLEKMIEVKVENQDLIEGEVEK